MHVCMLQYMCIYVYLHNGDILVFSLHLFDMGTKVKSLLIVLIPHTRIHHLHHTHSTHTHTHTA